MSTRDEEVKSGIMISTMCHVSWTKPSSHGQHVSSIEGFISTATSAIQLFITVI